MVRERDAPREDAQDERRVDLDVRVLLLGVLVHVAAAHRDERQRRLLDVQVLYRAVEHRRVPRLVLAERRGGDKERAHAAPRLCRDDDALGRDVPRDGRVHVDAPRQLHLLERRVEAVRVERLRKDVAVEQHQRAGLLGGRRLAEARRRERERRRDRAQHVLDQLRRRRERDAGHQRQVLDQADAGALGRLGGADDAPLRRVQLARLHQLARLFDGRVDAAQVGQRGAVRHAVEHLFGGVFSAHSVSAADGMH